MTTIYTYNGQVLTEASTGKWFTEKSSADPYNPLGLPPGTVRVRTSDGQPPVKDQGTTYETATLVQGTADVYDVYKSSLDFSNLLNESYNVVEVLGVNATGVTHMTAMFQSCTGLETVPLFDTTRATQVSSMFSGCRVLTRVPVFDIHSATSTSFMFNNCRALTTAPLLDTSTITNMSYMFNSCTALTTVPLLDTTSVTNMSNMFNNCGAVESGALALYQQASSQANPPTTHTRTFKNCGSNTVTGAAELAQIPSDWK